MSLTLPAIWANQQRQFFSTRVSFSMSCLTGEISSNASVIYVHPCGNLNDLIVPAGALSVVNALTVPCSGYYAFEVPQEAIIGAKILLMDCHWALSLDGIVQMAAMAHQVNPDIRVIVGGITASVWAGRILDASSVDYVVQGDAEDACRDLVREILEGRDPGPIPNVWSRGSAPPCFQRISEQTFSETNTIQAAWFPTFDRVSRLNTYSFSPARWIIAARGCARRCGVCYGSYSSSFGGDVLLRSPESVVRLIREAAFDGQQSLRIFFGRPPLQYIEQVFDLLAASPTSFSNMVGLYLCTPLTGAVMEKMRTAMPHTMVMISSVWPSEQEAAGRSMKSVRLEEAACLTMACDAGPEFEMEFWYSRPSTLRRLNSVLNSDLFPAARPVNGYTWNIARPNEAVTKGDAELEEMQWQQSMDLSGRTGLWQIARRLSPVLAELFKPFGDLDVISEDPQDMACPDANLASFWNESQKHWKLYNFPLLLTTRFRAWPYCLVGKPPSVTSRFPVPKGMQFLPAGSWRLVASGMPVTMDWEVDHHGSFLHASLPAVPPGSDGWVFLPDSGRAEVAGSFLAGDVLSIPGDACSGGGLLTVRLVVYRLQMFWKV